MRGEDQQQGAMYSYISPEQRVPQEHPLRAIREIVDAVLQEMSPEFARLYAVNGRPSIAPEKLLRALLLQVLYAVRSERLLMEQLDYNLLFRWFVGLNMDDAVWVPTVFRKHRDRLLEGDIAAAFFDGVVEKIGAHGLLSDEHFTVDGTLLEAWAGAKSFQRKDGKSEPPAEGGRNPTVNFHGEKRSNETHRSTTDPEEGPREGSQAELRGARAHGKPQRVDREDAVDKSDGNGGMRGGAGDGRRSEWSRSRDAGGRQRVRPKEIGRGLAKEQGDAAPDAEPEAARWQRLDGRTARHAGYEVSQRVRKRVEEIFGWMKAIGLLKKLRHRGQARVEWMFTFTAAAYNLVRARSLLAEVKA